MQVAAHARPGTGTALGSFSSIAAWIGGGVLVIGGAGALLRRRRAARKPAFTGGLR
jgi:hypothetical protein